MFERLRTWATARYRPRRVAREIHEEFEAHIEQQAADLVRAGMDPERAAAEARRRFGDVQTYRRAGQAIYGIGGNTQPDRGVFEAAGFDLRSAWRSLRQRPLITTLAIATLALGIGGNAALFSVVNAALLRPLPYTDADRVFLLWTGPDRENAFVNSYPDYRDWAEQSTSFQDMAAFNISTTVFHGGDEPEEVAGAVVSARFFDVLGVAPALGRTFRPEEMAPGEHRVIVLSHALWQRAFGGDPDIVGKQINDPAYTVIGVMPEDFDHPEPWWRTAAYWRPLAEFDYLNNRANRFLRVVARLRDGVTADTAQQELSVISERLREQYPTTNPGVAWLRTLREQFTGDVRNPLMIMLAAVAMILLIACTNVAHLLLARSVERQEEFAIRVAVGASPGSIVRLQLAEGMLLATCGAVAGLLLAEPLSDFLATLGPAGMPGFDDAPIDGNVVAFTVAATLLAGALISLLPAVLESRRATREQAGPRASAGRGTVRSRRLLIAAEVALTVPLLVAAAMLTQGLLRLGGAELGFRTDDVVSLRLSVSNDDATEVRAFFANLADQLQARAELGTVGLVSSLPLDGLNDTGGGYVAENDRFTDVDPLDAATRWATPEYFEVFRIPLLAGRMYNEGDLDSDEVVVSAGFAEAMWGMENAVGQRVRGVRRSDDDEVRWQTVVGVVGNILERGPAFEERPMLFSPLATTNWSSLALAVEAQAPPDDAVAAIREMVRAYAPRLPITGFRLMSERRQSRLAEFRFRALLLSGFATLGLVLAAIGIFGVVSYSVQQRVREIGIRLALGARSGDVSRLVVLELSVVVLAGAAVGLGLAFGAQRLLGHLITDLEALRPAASGAVAAILLLVAVTAAYLPARRATRVDPLTALRAD